MQTKRNLYFIFAFVLIGIFVINSQAFAARYLYDDFQAGYLDGQKWRKGQFAREVRGQKLASDIHGQTGPEENLLNQTPFQDPNSINSIQANVTVHGADLHNDDTNMAAAQIEGFFYNATDGDIWAGVFIGEQGNNSLEAWWAVTQDGAVIASGSLVGPGTLTCNTQYLAKIEYDGTNQITFDVAGSTYTYTEGPAKFGASVNQFKSLTTGIWGNGDRGHGYVHASFDDVSIDKGVTVYDDFATPPLDPAKWQRLEKIRQVSEPETDVYKLRSDVRAVGGDRQVKAPLKYSNTPYLEANVNVKSDSVLSNGAFGRARLGGCFYNDSRGPGSGQPYDGRDGDVFAQVALELSDAGSLRAICRADRSNADGSETTEVLGTTVLSTSLSLDTEYTLSIEFTGTSLIFKCNGETYPYTIATSVYEPSEYGRVLSSKIYSDTSGSGYLKAYFDDVYVDAGSISGVVVDENNNPLVGVEVNCWNEKIDWGTGTATDEYGNFELSGLPSGTWQVTVKPDANTTNLAWFVRHYYLAQGEEKDLGTIKLQQGALISGVIKDTVSSPLPNVWYWYGGKFEMGWGDTETDGSFAFRLPAGSYTLNLSDEADYVMVPFQIDVTDVTNDTIYANQSLTAYNGVTGHTIEGSVTGGSPPEGMELEVAAFLNSQTFTPENFGGVSPMGCGEPDVVTGDYSLFVPPTTARPDSQDVMVVLSLWSEGDDGNESLTVINAVQNQTTPATFVDFAYTSAGYTVDGYVKDSSGEGIFFATVLLYNSAEDFVGFAETDHTGKYTFYNVPAANYKVAVTHPDYPDDTEWSSGFLVDANVTVRDVFMGEEKEKFEGDFNGDGKSDILWRNNVNGTIAVWLMNGTSAPTTATVGQVNDTWDIEGLGDFDGNGTTDILWRNNVNGNIAVWLMNGTSAPTAATVGQVNDTWDIEGLAPLDDGNSSADILWRNNVNGNIAVWLMNGTSAPTTASVGQVNDTWDIAP